MGHVIRETANSEPERVPCPRSESKKRPPSSPAGQCPRCGRETISIYQFCEHEAISKLICRGCQSSWFVGLNFCKGVKELKRSGSAANFLNSFEI